MPAPANPEVFLQGAYGPDWRVPNPAFQFTTPRRDKRRIGGWFGGLRQHRDFWSRQYAAQADRIPRDPSLFAGWVAGQESPGVLVDVGCGNGRDTRFFAELGYDVTGLDLVPNASRRVLKAMEPDQRPEVVPFNLESLRQTLAAGARASFSPEPVTVYGRFLCMLSASAPGNTSGDTRQWRSGAEAAATSSSGPKRTHASARRSVSTIAGTLTLTSWWRKPPLQVRGSSTWSRRAACHPSRTRTRTCAE